MKLTWTRIFRCMLEHIEYRFGQHQLCVHEVRRGQITPYRSLNFLMADSAEKNLFDDYKLTTYKSMHVLDWFNTPGRNTVKLTE